MTDKYHIYIMDTFIIGSTGHLIDRHRQYAALVYARAMGCEAKFWPLFFQRRTAWLNWLTVTQRKWQQETRRPSKARHHDSIELREKYVRCV